MKHGSRSEETLKVRCNCLRPRARTTLKLEDIATGDEVMVNYNYDEPAERGYWYDAIVTAKRATRTIRELVCTVFVG